MLNVDAPEGWMASDATLGSPANAIGLRFMVRSIFAPLAALRRIVQGRPVAPDYYAAPQHVECHVDEARLAKMFARIQNQWRAMGESEPHWSVLTNRKFRQATISKFIAEFNASGEQDAAAIDRFFERAGIDFPKGMTCFELGCGVGRATRFLATRFAKVIAADISDHHIEVARAYLKTAGVENVDFVYLQRMDDLNALPQFDFFFSFIVLQHNPPPIQLAILERVLAKVASGGGCLFQAATEFPGYSFDAGEYLNSECRHNLEMHSLPMHEVLAVLQKQGFAIREVRPDNCTGKPGSFTFFAYPKVQRAT